MGAGQVMTVAPNHSEKTRAIETAKLTLLRIVDLFGVLPRYSQVVVEVGAFFPAPVDQRSVSGIAGDLQSTVENRRCLADVLHRNCEHIGNFLRVRLERICQPGRVGFSLKGPR